MKTPQGQEIKVVPVAMLLIEEVRLAGQKTVEVPPIPTYPVELPDGTILTYEHDEKSIETPEEKEAWSKYQAALQKQTQTASLKVMDLLFAKGVELDDDLLLHGEWREDQEFLGVKIPTHKLSLKLHYLRTEVLTSPSAITEGLAEIMEASGIDKSLVQAARNTFQRNMEQKEDTIGSDSVTIPDTSQGEMVHEPEILRVGNGEIMASAALTVGQLE